MFTSNRNACSSCLCDPRGLRLGRVSVGAPEPVKGPAARPTAAMDRPLRPGAPLSHNAGAPGHAGPEGVVR
jgi:hypothetical protein